MTNTETPTQRPVALVTGGSRGVGLSLVNQFKQNGFAVAAWARSEKSARAGEPDWAMACDVSNVTSVNAAMATLIGHTGRLDVVVNNAGIAGENTLEADASDAMWHSIINTNLHGPYYVTKAALPHLPDGTGRVIMIASVLGLKGVPDQSAYCASKHGLIGLTRSLALHLAPRQITVNAVCPGWIETDMATQRAEELSVSIGDLSQSAPLGRMCHPDEIARLCMYVASPESQMITGQTFTIDGGSTL